MKIVFDKRESGLIELLNEIDNNDINWSQEMLDIGDIHIFNEMNELEYLIERKTLSDVISSIIDGRYKNQKTRILDSIDKDKFIYLIEMNTYNKKYEKMINGFVINNIFRDNITILYSYNLKHSLDLILLLFNKLKYKEFLKENSKIEFVQTKKSSLIMNNKLRSILTTIPKISIEKSKAIEKHYNKLIDLIEDFKQKGKLCLKNIQVNNRKIGEKLSSDIYEFLMN
jgi:ERCC4-type nuclease